jgi:hypothetical protein
MKWINDKINARVVTEDDTKSVFYTEELSCPEIVFDNVVELHNNNTEKLQEIGSTGIIDDYLLNENLCSQEDREVILEQIYLYYKK